MRDSARRGARVLALLLAVLYVFFALDTAVLSVGLLIHLILAALILVGAIMAWNRARPGAVGFAGAAVVSILLFRTWSAPERFLLLTLPLAIVAALFRVAGDRPAGS